MFERAGPANTAPAKISIEDFNRLCAQEAPFLNVYGFVTEDIGMGTARVRMPANANHIRPGGTISGPAQMALGDFTVYAALLGAIGRVPLAVTTSLSINFLNKPRPGDIFAEGRLMKLGKRLAVAEVYVYPQGSDSPVSHVTATYSIPPSSGETDQPQ